jgi:hypothetical protein
MRARRSRRCDVPQRHVEELVVIRPAKGTRTCLAERQAGTEQAQQRVFWLFFSQHASTNRRQIFKSGTRTKIQIRHGFTALIYVLHLCKWPANPGLQQQQTVTGGVVQGLALASATSSRDFRAVMALTNVCVQCRGDAGRGRKVALEQFHHARITASLSNMQKLACSVPKTPSAFLGGECASLDETLACKRTKPMLEQQLPSSQAGSATPKPLVGDSSLRAIEYP